MSILPRACLRTGVLALAVVLIPTAPGVLAEGSFVEVMDFAADMAKRGNWREAKFRWEVAAKRWPNHRKIMNNLAVACETLGEVDLARSYYERAMALADDETVASNFERSARFWRQAGQANGTGPAVGQVGRGPRSKGKAMKVTVRLPVPPMIDVSGVRSLLVASFLTDESSMLDVNRELVRYLRSEFRKKVDFEILPISPPPAVPEQTIEDLIANREFWKHLGREYGADLIVSGTVDYDRRDASGFRDVDVISQTTGQKVRRSEFVEQEEFTHALDIIFMDGTTGELRHRDRLRRSAVFRGAQNDPITAFYELIDSLVPDVLAIVTSRRREDVRLIFRR